MHDWTLDEKQSEKLVNKALELGINLLIQRTAIFWELVKSILDVRFESTQKERKLYLHRRFILMKEDCRSRQSGVKLMEH